MVGVAPQAEARRPIAEWTRIGTRAIALVLVAGCASAPSSSPDACTKRHGPELITEPDPEPDTGLAVSPGHGR